MGREPLHDRIRRLRLRRGLSQRELAGAVGRDRTWVAHLERGALHPGRDQLRMLAWSLGIPARRLVRGTGWILQGPTRSPLSAVAQRFEKGLPLPGGPAPSLPPRTARLEPLLARVREPRRWTALGALGITDEDAWMVALALAGRGADPARIPPARLGFPLPLVLPDGRSGAHVRHPCLLWDGGDEALVLFGPLRVLWEGRQAVVPLVLGAAGQRNAFTILHGGRKRNLPLLPVRCIQKLTEEGAERLFEELLEEVR